MAKNNGKAGALELELLEQIESIETEIAQAREKRKAVYARGEASGVNKVALKQIIKDRKADLGKTAKLRADYDRIMKALGDFGNTELGEWAVAHAAAMRSARNTRAPKAEKKTDESLLSV